MLVVGEVNDDDDDDDDNFMIIWMNAILQNDSFQKKSYNLKRVQSSDGHQ